MSRWRGIMSRGGGSMSRCRGSTSRRRGRSRLGSRNCCRRCCVVAIRRLVPDCFPTLRTKCCGYYDGGNVGTRGKDPVETRKELEVSFYLLYRQKCKLKL